MSFPPAALAGDIPDLSACEREPIHIPGAIQGHGVLLAADPRRWIVEQASANAATRLGMPQDGVLGQPIDAILGSETAAALRSGELMSDAVGTARSMRIALPGGAFDLVAHQHDDMAVVELEAQPQSLDTERMLELYDRLQAVSIRVASASSADEICEIAAREAQASTGYEHVMVYRFDEDWSGRVVAEALAGPNARSYRDHRFPASDIPAQARELYRRNPLRFVFDVNEATIPIEPVLNPRTRRPLDLSHAAYRSIAPVHLAYLRNMGVAASLSISLLVDGALWGLIACHHRTPRTVPLHLRGAGRALAATVAASLSRVASLGDARQRTAVREALADLSSSAIDGISTVESIRCHASSLAELLGADALLTRIDEVEFGIGLDDAQSLPDLAAAFKHAIGGVLLSEHFAELIGLSLDRWPQFAGGVFLALGNEGDYLCFGFPERARSEIWAGDPRRPAEPLAGDTRMLSPRASFAAWRREVRGRSRAFTPLDAATAQSIREVILEHRGLDARRRAAEALSRAHELIDEVLHNVDAIVHVTDAHSGETLLLNEHARQLLGDDAEPLLARLPIPPAPSRGATHDVEDQQTGRWFDCRIQPIEWTGSRRARLLTAIEITARKLAERRLETLASTDELTGVANRRAFFERANEEIRRAARYKRALSLLMLDLDHFKHVNDEHGHQVGDEVLRAFADACRAQSRDGGDQFGRLGGEEFVMLLPETTLDAALDVAERIRARVAALRFPAGPATLRITVSIGVTQHTDADADGEAVVDTLIARADGALYDAKKAGRDRVVAHSAVGA